MALSLGGTVTQLQERMPLREIHLWQAYIQKYGPMSDVRRYDRPAALLAYLLNRIHGGKADMSDFMPFGQQEKEATMDDIIAAFGGVNIGKQPG